MSSFAVVSFVFLGAVGWGGGGGGEADLGIETGSLAQEGARNEPEAVGDGELVFDDVAVVVARMRVVPFVGREARHDEQRETDQDVGGHDVQPNLHGQWVHEREQARRLARRNLRAAPLSVPFSHLLFFLSIVFVHGSCLDIS